MKNDFFSSESRIPSAGGHRSKDELLTDPKQCDVILDVDTLLARCQLLEGLSFIQLASELGVSLPTQASRRKGWVGQAVERALGATAGSKCQPDFFELGIELKTIPLNHLGKPTESTFVTTIPLLTIHKQTWDSSQCYAKLKRVLWVPVEGDTNIPFPHRRIGRAVLWSPSDQELLVLANDWQELSFMIGTGKLAEIDGTMGHYLQVRPKAASGRSLTFGFDEHGNKILTMPRGFYLRSRFTKTIIDNSDN